MLIQLLPPGDSIDVLDTEISIAINPKRMDLIERFNTVNIPVFTIQELKNKIQSIVGIPERIEYDEKVIGIVEYRSGSIIDVLRKVK